MAIINEVNSKPNLTSSAITRRSASAYLAALMPQGGRIPVTAVVGDMKAWEQVRQMQAEALGTGVLLHATSHLHTLGPDGSLVACAGKSLLQRTQALLLNRRVQALLLVIQNDEILHLGMPVDTLDAVLVHNRRLTTHEDNTQPLGEPQVDRLVQTLNAAVVGVPEKPASAAPG